MDVENPEIKDAVEALGKDIEETLRTISQRTARALGEKNTVRSLLMTTISFMEFVDGVFSTKLDTRLFN